MNEYDKIINILYILYLFIKILVLDVQFSTDHQGQRTWSQTLNKIKQ